MKKSISLLLAVMLIFSTMLVGTFSVSADTSVVTEVSSASQLQSALTNGQTAKLTSNITISSTVKVPSGTTAAIDLNGFNITESVNYGIENKGTLTISGSGTITVGRGCVDNYGTLNVEGGTYKTTDSAQGAALFNNDANSVINFNSGTVEAAAIGISNYGAGTVVINGGKISNESYNYPLIFNNAKGKVEINGGEVTAKYMAVKNSGGGSVVVNDGTVHSDKVAAIYNSKGSLTINGGVISSECSSVTNTKAEGYQYTVVSSGDLYINGGEITGVHGAVCVEDGNVTITNGTITTSNSENGGNDAFYPLYVTACSGNVSCTIDGGTFTNNGVRTAVNIDGSSNESNGNGDITVAINDGTFTAKEGTPAIIVTSSTNGKDIDCEVTGGTFSDTSAIKYIADDSGFVVNEDGTISVKDSEELPKITEYGFVLSDGVINLKAIFNTNVKKATVYIPGIENGVNVPSVESGQGSVVIALAPALVAMGVDVVVCDENGSSNTYNINIAKYADSIATGNYSDELKAAVNALEQYANACSNQFKGTNYDVDASYDLTSVDTTPTMTGDTAFCGCSIGCKAKTSILFYAPVAAGSKAKVNGEDATADGDEYVFQDCGSSHHTYIEVPVNGNETVTVTLEDGSTITYDVVKAAALLEKQDSSYSVIAQALASYSDALTTYLATL
jgi:hypothetical protein